MKSKLSLLLALCCALMLVVSPAFALKVNVVKSKHIAEADGTTGQDTNTGKGVKTGHIQDGAVTDAKISGQISASKIEAGYFQQKFKNQIVVAKGGGDFSDPITAVNSITDASAMNPYLVKIMPGFYDLGSSAITMKEFVFIDGSGQSSTIIQTAKNHAAIYGSNNASLSNLTINNIGANSIQTIGILDQNASMVIKDVTISASGSYRGNIGLFEYTGSSSDISNVTVKATSVGTGDFMMAAAIIALGSTSSFTNVVAEASGDMTTSVVGFQVNGESNVTLNKVSAAASCLSGGTCYGLGLWDDSTTIVNSSAEVSGGDISYALFSAVGDQRVYRSIISGDINLDSGTLKIAQSEISGSVLNNSGALSCIDNFDSNFVAVACPQ